VPLAPRRPAPCTRRRFLARCGLTGAALALGRRPLQAEPPGRPATRAFHACLSPHGFARYPELPEVVAKAGITDVWMAGFLYGAWYQRPADLQRWETKLATYGLRMHVVNVPLGHPGNALGVTDDQGVPAAPPAHWRLAQDAEGRAFSGTSIHAPAPEENAAAVREIAAAGFGRVFLDDDFRVARSPGEIGGCFCDACREAFLRSRGYPGGSWEELLDAVRRRAPSQVLIAWEEYWCDQLEAMWNAMRAAAPEVALGIMVMYLGSEKAGIRLERFREAPFRVGELMFSDAGFAPVKGKTDELFSALFHRRFVAPERAYSESTAYPADQLSARNLAAKLTVSLIADVRNTMFMSGLLPFPIEHWATLGPAMRESARLHAVVAGHRPRGPLKHYWGEEARRVGDDRPYSLFLALGVPFEVVSALPTDGWAFLGDADARAVAEGRLAPAGRRLIARPESGAGGPALTAVPEDLPSLFRLKRGILPALHGVPYVVDDLPVVLAWYPSARAALLWNLEEERRTYTVMRDGQALRTLEIAPLGVALLERL